VIVGRVREDARRGLDRETGLRERIARLPQKHPVQRFVVLARDTDVIDDAGHTAGLQRGVTRLHEGARGGLSAWLVVVPVVDVAGSSQ